MENSLADLTPEQFEDYKRFREQQLKMMQEQSSQREQLELNQRTRENMRNLGDIQGEALRQYENQQFNYPQKEKEDYLKELGFNVKNGRVYALWEEIKYNVIKEGNGGM